MRAPDGVQQGRSFPEKDSQTADEGVAGAGRVDRVDPDRGYVLWSPCVERECAPRPQRDNDDARTASKEDAACRRRLLHGRNRSPREALGLGLVGDAEIAEPEQLVR